MKNSISWRDYVLMIVVILILLNFKFDSQRNKSLWEQIKFTSSAADQASAGVKELNPKLEAVLNHMSLFYIPAKTVEQYQPARLVTTAVYVKDALEEYTRLTGFIPEETK